MYTGLYKWNRKPKFGTKLDKRNLLTKRLMGFYAINEGAGGTLYDATGRLNLTASGYTSSPWVTDATGVAITSPSQSQYFGATLPTSLELGWPITWVGALRVIALTNGWVAGVTYSANASQGPYIAWMLQQNTGTWKFNWNSAGNGPSSAITSVPYTVGVVQVLGWEWSTTGHKLYLDGSLAYSDSTTSLSPTYGAGAILHLGDPFTYGNSAVHFLWAGWFNRILSPAEHATIGASPDSIWQIFQPQIDPNRILQSKNTSGPTIFSVPISFTVGGYVKSSQGVIYKSSDIFTPSGILSNISIRARSTDQQLSIATSTNSILYKNTSTTLELNEYTFVESSAVRLLQYDYVATMDSVLTNYTILTAPSTVVSTNLSGDIYLEQQTVLRSPISDGLYGNTGIDNSIIKLQQTYVKNKSYTALNTSIARSFFSSIDISPNFSINGKVVRLYNEYVNFSPQGYLLNNVISLSPRQSETTSFVIDGNISTEAGVILTTNSTFASENSGQFDVVRLIQNNLTVSVDSYIHSDMIRSFVVNSSINVDSTDTFIVGKKSSYKVYFDSESFFFLGTVASRGAQLIKEAFTVEGDITTSIVRLQQSHYEASPEVIVNSSLVRSFVVNAKTDTHGDISIGVGRYYVPNFDLTGEVALDVCLWANYSSSTHIPVTPNLFVYVGVAGAVVPIEQIIFQLTSVNQVNFVVTSQNQLCFTVS